MSESDDQRHYWRHATDEKHDTWARDLLDDLEQHGELNEQVIGALKRATGRASDGPWLPSFGNGPDASAGEDVDVAGRNRESDAAFVGVARTAMPLLLEEIVRLRDQNQRLLREQAAAGARRYEQGTGERVRQRLGLSREEAERFGLYVETDEVTASALRTYGDEIISRVRAIADRIDDPMSDIARLEANKLREAADWLERLREQRQLHAEREQELLEQAGTDELPERDPSEIDEFLEQTHELVEVCLTFDTGQVYIYPPTAEPTEVVRGVPRALLDRYDAATERADDALQAILEAAGFSGRFDVLDEEQRLREQEDYE